MVSAFSTQRMSVEPLRVRTKIWNHVLWVPEPLHFRAAVGGLGIVITIDDGDSGRGAVVDDLLGSGFRRLDVAQGCGLAVLVVAGLRAEDVERRHQGVPPETLVVEQLVVAVGVVVVAYEAVRGRRRVCLRLGDAEQVVVLLDFIVSGELLDGVVDGEGWWGGCGDEGGPIGRQHRIDSLLDGCLPQFEVSDGERILSLHRCDKVGIPLDNHATAHLGLSLREGLVNMNVDGRGGCPMEGHPTATDADVDNHIDAPAHNAISLETEVIHEGKNAHA